MARGEELYRLQQLDSERDAKQRRLVEIEATLKDDRALQEARESVKEAEERARKWQTRQRDLELEIESLSSKMSRSEKRLYGGKVKNPKELSDLQAEIASLKRRRQKLEDTLLEAMINREEAEATLDEAETRLEDVASSLSAQQADLRAERETLQADLKEIGRQRESILPRIEAEILTTYERVRERKGGQAVASIRGDACAACGVTVAPSLEWKLRQGELVHCDTCGRILVAVGGA
jgi:predicted  nucleic acid-binding Zn-ribbon protein